MLFGFGRISFESEGLGFCFPITAGESDGGCLLSVHAALPFALMTYHLAFGLRAIACVMQPNSSWVRAYE